MGSTKAQSAIEFLTTYAFVFLIITVVLVLLIMFSSIPKSTLPFTCAFYSGFQCLDTELAVNSSGAPTLLIMASDSEPGTVNISSFSAYLNFHNSKSGYCTPVVAQAGEEIYCIANFTGSVTLGSVYSGTFKIFANYCAPPPSNTTGYCASGSTYIYTGNIRVQATKFVLSNSYYLPISVTNNQGSAVPAQFQQMIEFKPSTYALEEGSNLGNIRFYFGSKELYSWCESNCSSSAAGNAIFWVKTPQAIPPGQTMTIDMYFLPKSVQYDGVYAGEAPQLSPTYAEYDNGANVFDLYFNGDTPTSDFATGGGDTVTQERGVSFGSSTINALRFTTGSSEVVTTVDMYTSASLPNNPTYYIAEASFQSDGSGTDMDWGLAQNSGTATSDNAAFVGTQYGAAYFDENYITSGSRIVAINSQGSTTTAWRYSSFNYTSSSSFSGYIAPQLYSTSGGYSGTVSANPIAGITNLYWGWWGNVGGAGAWVQFNWVRVRTYPPNGVMPSVTFGTLTPV